MFTLYYSLIIVFCIAHSLLVTNKVKRFMHRNISQSNYRILFNLVSAAFLVAIVWAYTELENMTLFDFKWQSVIGWILVVSGLVLSYVSFKSYNASEFLGITPEKENPHLAVRGMNRHVRHPLYLASFIMLWGAVLLEPTTAYLGFATILSVYIVVGTRLEEQKLVAIFGRKYLDYKNQVPMFFPRFYKHKV